MFDALGRAWVTRFGVDRQPTKPALVILLCQWVLETGWGKSCWDWNIGNFRSRDGDGRDWCLYECDERLSPKQANAYMAKVGVRLDGSGLPDAKIKSHNKDGTITVYFWPDNPMCRFRAFSAMEEGVMDYLVSLNKRFHKAWPSVVAGDPDKFVYKLKEQNYFTADTETYRKGVSALFRQLMAKNFEMKVFEPIIPEVEKEEVTKPDLLASANKPDDDGIDDDYRERVMGLVSLTLSESIRQDDDEPEKNV
jgi:hypothetical protein